MVIFAHICGPSGSGKTTLGNRIKKKFQFQFLVIKDLDDFQEHYKKEDKFQTKPKIEKDIKDFVEKNKTSNIILTGTNTLSNNNDFSDQIVYEIDAKYKYFIDIDLEIVLKRRFERHIEYISSNLDHYFNKALTKNKLLIDLELWKKKIQAPYNLEYYKKNNYKYLDNDKIYEDIIKKIEKNSKHNTIKNFVN